MASEVSKNWSGGKISSMVENERGAQFTIGFEKNQKPKVPDRLKRYDGKQKTADELADSQRRAAERKQKYDQQKAQQARKVNEEAIQFDEKVQAQGQHGRWINRALKDYKT